MSIIKKAKNSISPLNTAFKNKGMELEIRKNGNSFLTQNNNR